ncbi:hypothetical protein [Pseudomonas oryzihabitans]|uniref:hypothetical protein n=1 Tax=Pseudomonas oryzihabitans TaxID=47885 RepID=UPI001C0E254C|nr:hypothetical protein [Pseudomonas psychrotolerans]
MIERTISCGANAIFPELSLTAYEPLLDDGFAMLLCDPKLDVFLQMSDRFGVLIALGAPLRAGQGIEIAMFVFQPGIERLVYSKQILHSGELPYFSAGSGQYEFSIADELMAPAIYYESLQASHA